MPVLNIYKLDGSNSGTIEVKNEIFFNSDGTNIFGMNPSLNLQLTEDELAEKLISEIEKIDFLQVMCSFSWKIEKEPRFKVA